MFGFWRKRSKKARQVTPARQDNFLTDAARRVWCDLQAELPADASVLVKGWHLAKPVLAGLIPLVGFIPFWGYFLHTMRDKVRGKRRLRLLRVPLSKTDWMLGTQAFTILLAFSTISNAVAWGVAATMPDTPNVFWLTVNTIALIVVLAMLVFVMPAAILLLAAEDMRSVLDWKKLAVMTACLFPYLLVAITLTGVTLSALLLVTLAAPIIGLVMLFAALPAMPFASLVGVYVLADLYLACAGRLARR